MKTGSKKGFGFCFQEAAMMCPDRAAADFHVSEFTFLKEIKSTDIAL